MISSCAHLSGACCEISASVVVFQNPPEQVLACIDSISSANLGVRLIVIDNSPDDRLRAPISLTGAEYHFTGGNVGFGAGHNIAVRKILGGTKYHLVLNPDVRFGKGVLEALHAFIAGNPEVGLVMPRVVYPDGTEQHLCKRLPTPLDLLKRRFGGRFARRFFGVSMDSYVITGLDPELPTVVPCLSGCCMLIRTSVLGTVGLFDERFFLYMEDVDLCRRIGEAYATVFLPTVVICHEYQKGSYHSFKLTGYHIRSAWLYFWKWGWFFDEKRDRLNRRTAEYSRIAEPVKSY